MCSIDGYIVGWLSSAAPIKGLDEGEALEGRNKGRNQVVANFVTYANEFAAEKKKRKKEGEQSTCGVFDQKRLGPAERSAQGSPPERAEYAGSGRGGATFDRSADRRRRDRRRWMGHGMARVAPAEGRRRHRRLIGHAVSGAVADAQRQVQNLLVEGHLLRRQCVTLHGDALISTRTHQFD